jgi:hypothetical protein
LIKRKYPQGDSNARTWLRRPVLYPTELWGHGISIIPRWGRGGNRPLTQG